MKIRYCIIWLYCNWQVFRLSAAVLTQKQIPLRVNFLQWNLSHPFIYTACGLREFKGGDIHLTLSSKNPTGVDLFLFQHNMNDIVIQFQSNKTFCPNTHNQKYQINFITWILSNHMKTKIQLLVIKMRL